MIVKLILTLIIIYLIYIHYFQNKEEYRNYRYSDKYHCCDKNRRNCRDKKCEKPKLICPSACPDLSKYVLKSSIPPCPPKPDMSQYVLKSSIPPMPDMSKYVLKSSIPPCKCPRCPRCPPPTYNYDLCKRKCKKHLDKYYKKPNKNNFNRYTNTAYSSSKNLCQPSPADSNFYFGTNFAKFGVRNNIIKQN